MFKQILYTHSEANKQQVYYRHAAFIYLLTISIWPSYWHETKTCPKSTYQTTYIM